MLTEFQTKKLTKIFHLFDRTGDGFHTTADVQIIIDRIADMRGWEKGGDAYAALEKGYMDNWKQELAVMDRNEDGKISLEEHLKFYEMMMAGEKYDEIVDPVTEFIIGVFDTNKDGGLDPPEFAKLLPASGVYFFAPLTATARRT